MLNRYGTICLRRGKGLIVKPEAEEVDGRRYQFRYMWEIDADDRMYPGEQAWQALDGEWPDEAPIWVASGDIRFDNA